MQGKVDWNGQFQGLTSEEREHVGCVEYKAIRLLSYIVPIYFVGWQLVGCLVLGPYIHKKNPEAASANAVNPW